MASKPRLSVPIYGSARNGLAICMAVFLLLTPFPETISESTLEFILLAAISICILPHKPQLLHPFRIWIQLDALLLIHFGFNLLHFVSGHPIFHFLCSFFDGTWLLTCIGLLFLIPLPERPPALRPASLVGHKSIVIPATEKTSEQPLRVVIWYPAASTTSETRPVPLMGPNLGRRSAEQFLGETGIPAWFGTYMELAVGNGLSHAEFKPGRWPILLFSHGLTGIPENYTTLCENLAREGFIVVAPSHTDGSSAERWQPPPCTFEEDEAKFTAYRHEQLMRRFDDFQRVLFELRSAEAVLTSKQGQESHWDFSRIFVCGHSFGGVTAAYASKQLGYAGVAWDAWMLPMIENERTQVPQKPADFLWINAARFQWLLNLHRMLVCSKSVLAADPGRTQLALDVTDASHQNFSDIAALLPLLPWLLRNKPFNPLLGPIAPGLLWELVVRLTSSFLLERQSEFPRVLDKFASHYRVTKIDASTSAIDTSATKETK